MPSFRSPRKDDYCRQSLGVRARLLTGSGDQLIEELVHMWHRYKRLISWLSSVFAYIVQIDHPPALSCSVLT